MQDLTNFSVSYDRLAFKKVELIRHEGSLIAFAEATDTHSSDPNPRLYYNILDLNQQDEAQKEQKREKRGAALTEPLHKNEQSWRDNRYWTGFSPLPLPTEVRLAGMSLLTFNAEEPGNKPGDHWAIVSNGSDLYLFRSIKETGKIVLDGHHEQDNYNVYGNRYTLLPQPKQDGAEGVQLTLAMKTESRYRRSRMKDTPLHDKDSFSDLDMDDKPFTEPALSFHRHLNPYQNNFAVCVAPGHVPGRHRWQFIYEQEVMNADLQFCSVSILSSEDGWIDCADIVSQKFKMNDSSQKASLHLTAVPSTLVYRPQEKASQANDASISLPTAPRLLLAASMSTLPAKLQSFDVTFKFETPNSIQDNTIVFIRETIFGAPDLGQKDKQNYFITIKHGKQLVVNHEQFSPNKTLKDKIDAALQLASSNKPVTDVKEILELLPAYFAKTVVVDFPLQTEGDGTPFIPKVDNDVWVLGVPTIKKSTVTNSSAANTGWQALSAQMGILDWLSTAASPKLVDSADGRIHLYTIDKLGQLQVTQYDCSDVSRSRQSLPWQAVGQESQNGTVSQLKTEGTLDLIARQVGAQEMTTTLAQDAQKRLTLTLKSGDLTETWSGLPAEATAVAHILNGQASNNPLDTAVQNGSKPFYDYASDYFLTTLGLDSTTNGNLLVTRTRHQAIPGPHLKNITVSNYLKHSSIEGKSFVDKSKCTVALKFEILNHETPNVGSFSLKLQGVPRAAHSFAKFLNGDVSPQNLNGQFEDVKVGTLNVGGNALFLICSKAVTYAAVSVTNETCNLTLYSANPSSNPNTKVAAYEKLPCSTPELITSLNAQSNTNPTLLWSIGDGVSGEITDQTIELSEQVNYSHLMLLHSFPGQATGRGTNCVFMSNKTAGNVQNGSYDLKNTMTQGYEMSWTAGKDPETFEHLKSNGSAIVYAQNSTLLADGTTAYLQAKDSLAPATVGKSGAWLSAPTPSALSLSKDSKASASTADKSLPKGDFSLEAWIRPSDSTQSHQSIVSYKGDDEGLRFGMDLVNKSTIPYTFTVPKAEFQNQSFSVGFWLSKPLENFAAQKVFQFGNGDSAIHATLSPNGSDTAMHWFAETDMGIIDLNGDNSDPNLFYGLPAILNQNSIEIKKVGFTDAPIYTVISVAYTNNFDAKDDLGKEIKKTVLKKAGIKAQLTLTIYQGGIQVGQAIYFYQSKNVTQTGLTLIDRFSTKQQVTVWNKALSSDDCKNVQDLIKNKNAALVAQYDFSSETDLTTPVTKKTWNGRFTNTHQGDFCLSASASHRYVRSKHVELSSKQWAQTTAVCTNNTALQFDGTQKGVCYKSETVDPEEAFSIDAIVQFDDASLKKQNYLLAKMDETGQGFALGIDENGALSLTFLLQNKKAGTNSHFTVSSSDKLFKKDKPYYIAIGAALTLERAQDKIDFNASQISTKTKLTYFVFIQDLSDANSQSATAVTLNGVPTTTNTKDLNGEWHFQTSDEQPLYLGCLTPEEETSFFKGQIGQLRFWERDISADAPHLATFVSAPSYITPPAINWRFDQGEGKNVPDTEDENAFTLDSAYMWTDSRLTAEFKLYVNGSEVETIPTTAKLAGSDGKTKNQLLIGASEASSKALTNQMFGQLSEIRLWQGGRSGEQVADNLFQRLNGTETGLVAYWPLNGGNETTAVDQVSPSVNLTLNGTTWYKYTDKDHQDLYIPPLGADMPIVMDGLLDRPSAYTVQNAQGAATAVEYGELQTNEAGLLQGVMKRGYAYIKDEKCFLVTGYKVGDLAMRYLGQVQTHPQLYGYIEGAPPLPSENMTHPYWTSATAFQSYVGASSVTLTEADNTVRSFSADRNHSFKTALNMAFGPESKVTLLFGLGAEAKAVDFTTKPFTIKSNFDMTLGLLKGASVSNGSTKTISNTFAAAGNWEGWDPKSKTPIQEALGRRYIPDNIGYALVKSRVANVYALSLSSNGALVGLHLSPDPDIPEDFNILIFPIKSSYTKQGTLDGKIGFFNDPDYPQADQERGSYYKPKEAYSLIAQIEAQEAALNDAYSDFNTTRKAIMGSSEKEDVDYGSADAVEWRKDRQSRSMVNSYIWTAASGLYAEEEQTAVSRQESSGSSFDSVITMGGETSFDIAPGVFFDVDAMFGFDAHTTVMKSKEEGRDFSLEVHVDAEGFLDKWIEGKDGQAGHFEGKNTPGKVLAYRFKTFYMAPDKSAFNTFFNDVVDPKWLNSAEPDAVALRAAKGRPNQVWRVMHRVTFVSRIPATGSVPLEETTAPSRPAVNLTDNQALIDKIADAFVSKTADTVEQRIGLAVRDFLNDDLKSQSGEWQALLNGSNGESAADKQKREDLIKQLERAVYTYMCTLSIEGLEDNKTHNAKNWHESEGGAS